MVNMRRTCAGTASRASPNQRSSLGTPRMAESVSALTRTDPLLLMEADPPDAHEFVVCCAASGFFVWLRAVSSSRPTFQSAPGAAAVRGGAEQPGATRSALQRAWRGLRAPDLERRAHGATIVVGGT